jgi:hypothetical protein
MARNLFLTYLCACLLSCSTFCILFTFGSVNVVADSFRICGHIFQERLRAIAKDKRLYTMDESEVKVQKTLLKPERSRRDSMRLSRQLSRRYPGMPLDKALREENTKLRKELEHMKVSILLPSTPCHILCI